MNIASTCARILFTIGLAMLTTPGLASAEDLSTMPDELCDYCKDYTDNGASAGSVRSAYRPGTGYARETEIDADRATAQANEQRDQPGAAVVPEARASDKPRS